MPGHGSKSWKQPRTIICACGATVETYGPNTKRCPVCRQARNLEIRRTYNREKRPALHDGQWFCQYCRYQIQCRELVRTQAPVFCQRGDRKKLKAGEIKRLETIPALYLVDIARLADLWMAALSGD